MTRHVVMFSAGVGSWAAAKRVATRHGTANLTLLFTDVMMEDEDAYRFLVEGAANVLGINIPTQMLPRVDQFPDPSDREAYKLFVNGLRLQFEDMLPGLVWIARGGDIWDVFRQERFLGNSSADPCSREQKRELAASWLRSNCDPADTIVYVGIDKFEEHRFDDGKGHGARARYARLGWRCEAPLCETPFAGPWDTRREMMVEEIRLPRLYREGFAHNNCGGGCVKMGHAQAAHLFRVRPHRYALWEREEQAIRDFLGKDVSMLTDRSGDGLKKTLTLRAFRERLEADPQGDLLLDDWNSGCGCFLEAAE